MALPLLFFCVLPFLGWGAGWTASLTASSQKPMLALGGSPQTLLESPPQLEETLVLMEPHTELLRGVWKEESALVSHHTYEAGGGGAAPTLLGWVTAACGGCGSFLCFICWASSR